MLNTRMNRLLSEGIKLLKNEIPDFKHFEKVLNLFDIKPDEMKIPDNPLRSVFSEITLPPQRDQNEIIFPNLPYSILNAEKIAYPQNGQLSKKNNRIEFERNEEKIDIKNTNMQLVFLEKYGSFVGISDANKSFWPLYDTMKCLAAIDICMQQAEKNNSDQPFLLVSGDFSGIQNAVYTISSKGALKTLRARSFMLEIIIEHVIYEILTNCNLDAFHTIFSGGGGFALLIANTNANFETVSKIKEITNNWLFGVFSGKLYLALKTVEFGRDAFVKNEFNDIWQQMMDKLEQDKQQKFKNKLEELFKCKPPEQRTNAETCQICHRDDIEISNTEPFYLIDAAIEEERYKKIITREQLTALADVDGNIVVDETCYHLFRLGDKLLKFDFILRTSECPAKPGYLKFKTIKNKDVYYSVVAKNKLSRNKNYEFKWVKNNWDLEACQDGKTLPLMFANYSKSVEELPEQIKQIERESYMQEILEIETLKETDKQKKQKIIEIEKEKTASFEGLANCSCGADFIGALRMDVDNMGLIMSSGLEAKFNLITLSALSRQLNLFFKVYLNEICRGNLNLPEPPKVPANRALNLANKKNYPYLDENGLYREYESEMPGRYVSVIYSGGDDLFIIGAWDEVAELAYDINHCFKEFTGHNPDLSLSAGFTFHQPNYPLYQMASLSGKAEEQAKNDFGKCDGCGGSIDELDVPDCSLYLDKNGKCAKKKSNLAPFYNPVYNIKQENLEKRKKYSGDRLKFVLDWKQSGLIGIADDFIKLCEKNFNGQMIDSLQLTDVSRGFLYKIFEIAEIWQNEGNLYLPRIVYLFSQLQRRLKDKLELIPHLESLKKQLFTTSLREENIKSLYLPLTWIDLLQRKKGEQR